MPMRNAGAFLAGAITSILTQSERDFNFLIIDDGSDDESLEIAGRLADRRVEIIQDGQHLGLAARLNWGLDHAHTRFVARMDADDIAAPRRLSRQLAFMEANPQVGICGSWYIQMEAGLPPAGIRLPLDHASLRALTLFASPFAHSTVMFDLQHLDAAGLRYAESATHAEDYDLWERACTKTVFANIPEYLLCYRLHPGQASALHREQQRNVADGVRMRALRRLGFDPTPSEMALHCDYASGRDMDRPDRLKAARGWLHKLEATARQRGDAAIAAECARRAGHLNKRLGHSGSSLSGVLGRLGQLLHGKS
jgi:glycosyltransferase involved in cell wall biosynthesis